MKGLFRNFRPFVHIPMILGGLVIVFFLSFLFGLLVMVLWNWLMPVIFGLPVITYWQAWGLVLLSHILIKGGPGGHNHDHHERGDEWKNKFRMRMKAHFGGNEEEPRSEKKENEESGNTDPEQSGEGEA
ncbi:MAG: hypothetical protein JW881_02520 [Spirochaetales bacterium]|nr:hypothetical protein [Spirochaetales bacterium]